MALRKDQSILLLAGLASLVVWLFPFFRPFLLPLVYYNTHIHELCHALAAVVTGGDVERILVYANGNGVTSVFGGSPWLLASSGYVGSAIVGGMLIAGSRTEKGARRTLWTAAGFLLFSLLFFVRGETIGVVSAISWIAVLFGLGHWLKQDKVIFAAQFLGIQQCITSAHAFLVLLQLTAFTDQHNDAKLLEDATRIPALVSSVSWLVISAAIVFLTVRHAWSTKPK